MKLNCDWTTMNEYDAMPKTGVGEVDVRRMKSKGLA
jgi:hypothetical protein